MHCVCNACNQSFGDSLELAFNRDSWEALSRFRFGLKAINELHQLGYRNISVTYSGPGQWHGVRLIFFNEGGDIVLDLIPQAGLMDHSGRWFYFTLKELENLTREELGNFQAKGQIRVFAKTQVEYDKIVEQLRRLQIKFTPAGELDGLQLDKDLSGPTEIRSHMTSIVVRAICKIAFNYLAYCLGPEYATRADFSEVREFIRTGRNDLRPKFTPSNVPILMGEPQEGFRKLGHILVLDWQGGGMRVRVSLFNDISYSVSLCRYYSGIIFDIRQGHFFNLQKMEVQKLHHTSKLLLP